MTCVPGCLLQDKPCQVPLLKLRICIDTYLYSHTKGDIQKTKTGKIASKKYNGLTDWEHGTPLKITDHDFKNFFKFG